jgi:hypothetical protein
MPEENSGSLLSFRNCHPFEQVSKLYNISPPKRSFLLLARKFPILIIIVPNKIDPGDVCSVVEFAKEFQE